MAKYTETEITCKICGTKLMVPTHQSKWKTLCGSEECRRESNRLRGTVQQGFKQSAEHVAKRMANRREHFPDWQPEGTGAKISAGKLASPIPQGRAAEANSQWRGGVTRDDASGYRCTAEYTSWADAVLERDHHACRFCGSTQFVVPHHIASYRSHPSLRIEVSNGLSLCRSCHKKLHDQARSEGVD